MGLPPVIMRVLSFIQVRVVYDNGKTEVKRTIAIEGNKPEWNEVLEFALRSRSGRGFSADELINSNIMLYISIFDEVRDVLKDEFTGLY